MGRQARQLIQNSRWKDGWKSFTIPTTKWLNGWCFHDFSARVLAYYFGKINDFVVDWIYWSLFFACLFRIFRKGPLQSPYVKNGKYWKMVKWTFLVFPNSTCQMWKNLKICKCCKTMNLSSCHIILVVFDAVYSVAFSLQPPCCLFVVCTCYIWLNI